jgi:hypothetical protein
MNSDNQIDCGLDEHLTILRAVDAAHKSRRISSKLRYQILQSLFPPLEHGPGSTHDFWFYRGSRQRCNPGKRHVHGRRGELPPPVVDHCVDPGG